MDYLIKFLEELIAVLDNTICYLQQQFVLHKNFHKSMVHLRRKETKLRLTHLCHLQTAPVRTFRRHLQELPQNR